MATSNLDTKNRLGPTFHRTFSLVRSAVSQVLEIVDDLNQRGEQVKGQAFDSLREGTNLGTVYVAAMPRYAVGTGLLEDKTYELTSLGKVVYERDPDLNHPATQWLMHYHLSAPKGPGPLFWHYLVSQKLRFGARLGAKELKTSVRDYLKEIEGTKLVDRSARSLITVFAGTYTKVEGLGKLRVLEEIEEEQGEKSYLVQETDPPSPGALGYALAHYWESLWGVANVVPLSELSKPGGFADLFFLDAFQLNPILRELQSRGLLSLWQIASPHQVSRGWEQKEVFLDLLYE